MAVGKNKRLTKGGKKGGKKKAGDPFLKKEWYDIKAPSAFGMRSCGKTLISKTQGTKIASEEMKGRVFELNLADLNNDEDQSFKKIKLCIEDVQGRNCLTDFHALSLTRDKLCMLIRKWHTMIEAYADVKTIDGYMVRLFSIAFTKRRTDQVATNCYAQTAQIRRIRAKMVDIIQNEAGKVMLRDLVKKLIAESIGKEIEKQTQGIFPLKDCLIRKVKILKKPKFDIAKLIEVHCDAGEDEGPFFIGRPSAEDAQNVLVAEVAEIPSTIVTLNVSPCAQGFSDVVISCTAMSGDEIASLRVDTAKDRLGDLKTMLSHAGYDKCTLVMPDGRLFSESDNTATLNTILTR